MENKDDMTYEKLVLSLKSYMTDPADLALVDKAFHYAYSYHEGETRLTGDPYITHPLNVAYILSTINADKETICAALLHDVLEDNLEGSAELEQTFGPEITKLVVGVTKINRLNFNGDKKAVIESHRKILVGLSEDVRVIIIKLADRLHNMRTLWVIPPESQKEKANETLNILSPIASRLGMNSFKSELDDLAFRYLKPDLYFAIVEELNQERSERVSSVDKMINEVSAILDKEHIKYKIKGRAKSIYSIYKKLDKGKKLSDIYDLLALRVYVDTKRECYQALGAIHAVFKPMPNRFKDYIALPKANMYQSLHTTVFGTDDHIFEIQIRTYDMDRLAEYGIASHWSYKEHGSTKANMQDAMEQKLQFFRSLLEVKNDSDDEFLKAIQEEVLKENIYVFTPRGDVIELPNGSTPIDFAYRVHSGVGDHMIGAIVNGNIVPLDYMLKTNDIVKINTNKSSAGPSKEWINMAFTTQTKNKIKAFFNKIDKEYYHHLGKDLLDKELRKRKIPNQAFYDDKRFDEALADLGLTDLDDLLISLGNNKLSATTFINNVYSDNLTREDLILKKTNHNVVHNGSTDDIIVEGIDRIKVNLASCCKPIPGDKIVGYITKGNGISIHRLNCPNLNDNKERMINVHWNEQVNHKYATALLINALDNKHVLLDIISKTSNNDITIQTINTLNSSNGFLFELTVLVNNLEALTTFMNNINSIPDILSVERVIK